MNFKSGLPHTQSFFRLSVSHDSSHSAWDLWLSDDRRRTRQRIKYSDYARVKMIVETWNQPESRKKEGR